MQAPPGAAPRIGLQGYTPRFLSSSDSNLTVPPDVCIARSLLMTTTSLIRLLWVADGEP